MVSFFLVTLKITKLVKYPSNVKEYRPGKKWKIMQTILQVSANFIWPLRARQPRNSKTRRNINLPP